MTSLSRLHASPSTALLLRILERPGLVAAVRELPGAVLGKLIDRIGLEDAGELVALASTAQLERIFDDDLWRADRPGGDETFRPERFALWLRVMLEAGEEALVQRLCELPHDLVALAVHRLVLVLDTDVLEDLLSAEDEEAERIRRALEDSFVEEWEEFRLIARDADAWDDVWNALLALDRDHHDRLRAILEQCCEMTTEYISGQGGLYQVLTADEMLDSDVAAARDDRRVAEGYVSPADARAFLELARRGEGGEGRDPIARAYFRALAKPTEAPQVDAPRERGAGVPAPARDRGTELAYATDARDLTALLREVEVVAPAQVPLPARTAGDSNAAHTHLVAPLFEQAMSDLRQRDPERFSARVRELSYLVNVWIAGGAHEGRRPRPVEALERVLKTCEAGMRTQLGAGRTKPEEALAVLVRAPADALFRRGFRAAGCAAGPIPRRRPRPSVASCAKERTGAGYG
jgi:Family of unknown function (DUF6178)